ncbi:hypothetical protein NA57DRAFT_56789 [Rhizodiscina lignyota]|uniref:Uncharacterized protein n=1 Tax=Rhizodiscina lignyota TaxID=1504668 RepID=A0A9P4IGF7_9PEZI|nr:hypothetical protein NA57DRAFT_56789 [Rhizodiscina lignyota]
MKYSLLCCTLLALFSKSNCWSLTLYPPGSECISGGITITGSDTTPCTAITDTAATAFEFFPDNQEAFVTLCTPPASAGCSDEDACEVFGDTVCLVGGPWSSYQVVVAD